VEWGHHFAPFVGDTSIGKPESGLLFTRKFSWQIHFISQSEIRIDPFVMNDALVLIFTAFIAVVQFQYAKLV